MMILGVIGITGCSKGTEGIPAVPASGTVTLNGKPLEQGTIQFVPSKSRPAYGEIKDGKFTLTTYVDGDGAVPGKHKVGVTAVEEVPNPKGGEPIAKSLVPSNCTNPETSGYEVEIPPQGKTDIQIDFKGTVGGSTTPGRRPRVMSE